MEELKWIEMPEKGFRLEKDFTTYWLWKLEDKWFWKKKWSDAAHDTKPYDCNIRTNLDSYHCEIKMIKKDQFSFDLFQPNQIKALNEIAWLWGKAIVVIYSIFYNKYTVHDFLVLKKTLNYNDI